MISSIAISTIFIASLMLSGSQFSQQALAIHEGTPTAATQNQLTGGNATTTGTPTQSQASIAGNTTAPSTPTTGATPDTTTQTQTQAVPGGNATESGAASAPTPTPTAAVQEPPVNQNFVRQATVASGQDPLREGEQLAFILPPRSDGGVYSGVLTYTASKPVDVVVLHNYDPQNTTSVPEEYGTELTSPLPGGGGNIALTQFQPPYTEGFNSASVPFTGNGLALHTTEEGPFTATYTVNAFATQPESANAPLEFVAEEGEVEEPAAEDEAADEEEDAGAEEEDAGAEGGAEEEEPEEP
ncbi:MAG TPA: hypothetical protein VFR94_05580 [Nitrososphaeraceae archaeon]|nr:hypothetical protein [Nitrososphaeraceae archaeon]